MTVLQVGNRLPLRDLPILAAADRCLTDKQLKNSPSGRQRRDNNWSIPALLAPNTMLLGSCGTPRLLTRSAELVAKIAIISSSSVHFNGEYGGCLG